MEKREFVSLKVPQFGFVVYGIGAGVNECWYRGKPLSGFLDELWLRFPKIKTELNELWSGLDKQSLDNPANRTKISRLLEVGFWAYALACEMRPFQSACVHGPTDPLHHFYIRRLE